MDADKVERTYDSWKALGEAVVAAGRLGFAEIEVTTVVEPRFEHLPERCRYYMTAKRPVAPSRALASTRASR